jgi:MFS transporter, PAT family, beta-lactamase induction signal transducer AmpG
MSVAAARMPGSPRRPEAWRLYLQPRVLCMMLLGFSSGLPFFPMFQTLSAWLRQAGIERSTIGMVAWVGLAYSIKFLWAPLIDRARVPLVHRFFGQRRGWMLLAQAGIAFGLFHLSLSDPSTGIRPIALWALFVAVCGATQDIAIDAWRIESADGPSQGPMAAAYQVGARAALLVGGAGALVLAQRGGWHFSYMVLTALVGVGVLTTLAIAEPAARAGAATLEREARVVDWLEARAHWPEALRSAGAWFIGAVICPFVDFFARYPAAVGGMVIAFMCVYRLTEFAMGSMANPFYIDHGYTLLQIATVVKGYGLPASLLGVVIAGVLVARAGLARSLLLGSVLIMASNIGFSILARSHTPTLLGLGAVNSLDNIAAGIHGIALIAFLSSLTSPRYTATQYALFSSLYSLLGKLLEGYSGRVVDAIGYPNFFLFTAALSIPGLVLLLLLYRYRVVGTTSDGR